MIEWFQGGETHYSGDLIVQFSSHGGEYCLGPNTGISRVISQGQSSGERREKRLQL